MTPPAFAGPEERRRHKSSDPDTAQARSQAGSRAAQRTAGLREASWPSQSYPGDVSQNQMDSHSRERNACNVGFPMEPRCESLSKGLAAPKGQHHLHAKGGRSFWNMELVMARIGSQQKRRLRHQQPLQRAQGLKLGLGQS